MNKIGSMLIVLTLATPLIGPIPSAAESALAIGSTGNVVKDGIAMGDGYNAPTREVAIAKALAECGAFNAPKARPYCQIVGTFTGQCDAIALDPKPGTPGVGWAIAATKEVAESQALANCQVTAGPSRRQFCAAQFSHCDTATQPK